MIKLAPVIQKFSTCNKFETVTVFVGQQPDLMKPFTRLFNIHVNISFDNIMSRDQPITGLLSRIMAAADEKVSISKINQYPKYVQNLFSSFVRQFGSAS